MNKFEYGKLPPYHVITPAPKSILIPIPEWGFDPTEVAVSWNVLVKLGHNVTFATPTGEKSKGCDPVVLEGILGGSVMKVHPEPLDYYNQMILSPEYENPISYADIDVATFNAIFVPGGHAEGMNTMLRSSILPEKISAFFEAGKPIAGICHGMLALARTRAPGTEHSILHGKKVTSLPFFLEFQAYIATHYLAGLPGPSYQLSTTWPHYVEDEVREAVGGAKYDSGPLDFVAPFVPGTHVDNSHAFVVEDGQFITARFWGDTYLLAQQLARKLDMEGVIELL